MVFSHRKQNSDYIDYLMKALYFECRKREDWESKADSDLDQFSWETSRIKAKEMVRMILKRFSASFYSICFALIMSHIQLWQFA